MQVTQSLRVLCIRLLTEIKKIKKEQESYTIKNKIIY